MSQIELSKAGMEERVRLVSLCPDHLNTLGASRDVQAVLADLGEEASDSSVPHILTVDMSGIERITSIGLNELIVLNSQARNLGVHLVLLDVRSVVCDVFKLTRLERMFDFGASGASS